MRRHHGGDQLGEVVLDLVLPLLGAWPEFLLRVRYQIVFATMMVSTAFSMAFSAAPLSTKFCRLESSMTRLFSFSCFWAPRFHSSSNTIAIFCRMAAISDSLLSAIARYCSTCAVSCATFASSRSRYIFLRFRLFFADSRLRTRRSRSPYGPVLAGFAGGASCTGCCRRFEIFLM